MGNFMPRPLYPREGAPVPTEKEATWAPKPVWTFCGKYPVRTGRRTADR